MQLLQFQTDVSSARLAKVQALTGLRDFSGYDAVPATSISLANWHISRQPKLDDLQAQALRERPDYRGGGIRDHGREEPDPLAKANSKVDVNGTYNFSHVAGENTASIFASFPLPVFDRNQGEIARTLCSHPSRGAERSASDTVLSDVANAYEAAEAMTKSCSSTLPDI